MCECIMGESCLVICGGGLRIIALRAWTCGKGRAREAHAPEFWRLRAAFARLLYFLFDIS